jgi:hypothetical protein
MTHYPKPLRKPIAHLMTSLRDICLCAVNNQRMAGRISMKFGTEVSFYTTPKIHFLISKN